MKHLTKRLKKALDSIEAYKAQQLERLRENYHQQVIEIYWITLSELQRIRNITDLTLQFHIFLITLVAR